MSFKYPSSYELTEYPRSLDLLGGDTHISLTMHAVGRGGDELIQTTDLIVDGNPAKKYIFGPSPNQINFIQVSADNINNRKNDITIFFTAKDNKIIAQEKIDVFDQILSTFKFTN